MSMPRDGGDPGDTIDLAEPERRGRRVPEAAPRVIEIAVGGVVLGSIDPRTVKARAQFDLEDGLTSPTPASALLRWLVTHAGLAEADVPSVREELAEMPVAAIIDLFVGISEAIGRGMQLPNASRRASRRR